MSYAKRKCYSCGAKYAPSMLDGCPECGVDQPDELDDRDIGDDDSELKDIGESDEDE